MLHYFIAIHITRVYLYSKRQLTVITNKKEALNIVNFYDIDLLLSSF